jgi:hypothetical protein
MSYAPTVEYRELRRVGPMLKPDLVVVVVNPSDVQDEIYYEQEGVKGADREIERFQCSRWKRAGEEVRTGTHRRRCAAATRAAPRAGARQPRRRQPPGVGGLGA